MTYARRRLQGALVLEAWVREGDLPGWKTFRYCNLRSMEVLDESFTPREHKLLSSSLGLRGF